MGECCSALNTDEVSRQTRRIVCLCVIVLSYQFGMIAGLAAMGLTSLYLRRQTK